MKRRDLIRRIAAMAREHDATWEPKPGKQRGPHQTFLLAGHKLPIPRHREIGESLAATIMPQARAIVTAAEIDGKGSMDR